MATKRIIINQILITSTLSFSPHGLLLMLRLILLIHLLSLPLAIPLYTIPSPVNGSIRLKLSPTEITIICALELQLFGVTIKFEKQFILMNYG
jgi:hypothetical protein